MTACTTVRRLSQIHPALLIIGLHYKNAKILTISYTTYCHFYTCGKLTNPKWLILSIAEDVEHPWS